MKRVEENSPGLRENSFNFEAKETDSGCSSYVWDSPQFPSKQITYLDRELLQVLSVMELTL